MACDNPVCMFSCILFACEMCIGVGMKCVLKDGILYRYIIFVFKLFVNFPFIAFRPEDGLLIRNILLKKKKMLIVGSFIEQFYMPQCFYHTKKFHQTKTLSFI